MRWNDHRRIKQGFALVSATFVVVILGTVIAGNMLNMMRFQRETQSAIDRTRLTWAGDAMIERALKLFKAYVVTKNQFPDPDQSGNVLGEGSQLFSVLVRSWWTGINGVNGTHPQLNRIQIQSNFTIKELKKVSNQERLYEVSVPLKDSVSQVQATLSQQLLVRISNLFGPAVFSVEDIELAPGPDSFIQGPLFTNKNAYLMNDAGKKMTLKRAADFATSPDYLRYVLHAAGHIYFYFKREMGENYLLGNETYRKGVPDYYLTDTSPYTQSQCKANDGTIHDCGIEIFPLPLDVYAGNSFSSTTPDGYPPRFYYFLNGADLGTGTYDQAGLPLPNGLPNPNRISVEDQNGYLKILTPSRPRITDYFDKYNTNPFYPHYTAAYSRPNNPMSISTGFDPSKWPVNIADDVPWVSPFWQDGIPPANFGMGWVQAVIADGDRVSEQNVPIGDPNHPDGIHALIDPLTNTDTGADLFPPNTSGTRATVKDTDDVKKQKLQYKANINIYRSPNGTWSQDYVNLDGKGVLQLKDFYDYRIGQLLPVLEIDLGKLFVERPDARIIYVHTYELGGALAPKMVILKNGKKLPRGGFTVATNGRLWMKGDYNIYSYDKLDKGLCTSTDDSQCYLKASEWDGQPCKTGGLCIPPAAIFSDSIGILSKDWQESWGSGTLLTDRRVTQSVMVNAAVVTGLLPSQLKKKYPNCASSSKMEGCEVYRVSSNNALVDLNLNVLFECPDGTYKNGKGGVTNTCEYYQEGEKIYYLNPKSDMYQAAAAVQGSSVTPCNPNTNECDQIRIPIFTDPKKGSSKATGSFFGLYFKVLNRNSLTGTVCQYKCKVDGAPLGNYCQSTTGTAENPDPKTCYYCSDYTNNYDVTCSSVASPSISYSDYDMSPLYTPYYSGGLENLINYQEMWWSANSGSYPYFRFSGTLSVLWLSKELFVGNVPKYFSPPELPAYYTAPRRKVDFNESLKEKSPPGTPSVVTIERQRWSEKGYN